MTLLDDFITLAQTRPNIVAIGTEGATNNPATTPDAWQDLDITLFATDPAAEAGDWWLGHFGTPTIVQRLANVGVFTDSANVWHTWLTRFPGTRRIDLKIAPATETTAYEQADTLNAIVWTRAAGRLAPRATSAKTHWVSLPAGPELTAHANEFYWIAGNVCKGLARQNYLYANEQFNQHCRPELLTLLTWRASAKVHGQFDAGVSSKFLWPTLREAERRQLAATYDQASLAGTRTSLQAALTLYTATLPEVARLLALPVPDFAAAQAQLSAWLSA